MTTLEPPTPEDTAGSGSPDANSSELGLLVTRPRTDATVVTVSGEVDEATVARFEEVLAPRLLAAVRVVVLDLSAVEFLGVSGLQLLSQSHLRARDRGLALRVVATGHEVPRALRVAGLDVVLSCHATVADALSVPTAPGHEPA